MPSHHFPIHHHPSLPLFPLLHLSYFPSPIYSTSLPGILPTSTPLIFPTSPPHINIRKSFKLFKVFHIFQNHSKFHYLVEDSPLPSQVLTSPPLLTRYIQLNTSLTFQYITILRSFYFLSYIYPTFPPPLTLLPFQAFCLFQPPSFSLRSLSLFFLLLPTY